MNHIPDDIRRVAELGWRVYPASSWPGSKAALVSMKKDGKPPHEMASSDLEQIAAWAEEHKGCN